MGGRGVRRGDCGREGGKEGRLWEGGKDRGELGSERGKKGLRGRGFN